MALQGDLNSFALPDVLRLLAGTGKSGRLQVTDGNVTGELLLADGTISASTSTAAPHAAGPSDVVFELLRLPDGSFNFEEGEVTDAGLAADVEETISAAEQLIVEWEEVEAVVPSMDAWATLATEIDAEEILVSQSQWKALAAIAAGGNVHDLAAALELTDLAACRQVKDLIEAGLVDLRPSHGYTPPPVQLDDFDQFEADAFEAEAFEVELTDPLTDFEDLVVEDRPVVMEDREDALLPEPLPGEGVAYEGESITGMVDGRAHEAPMIDAPEGEAFTAFESLASFEQEAAMSAIAGEPGTTDTFGDISDLYQDEDDAELVEEIDESYEAYDSVDGADSMDADEAEEPAMEVAPAAVEASEMDDERGSLLKFLSTVKP